jgi:hypothetical protein|tara:strand:+ start:1845 stop:2234 length:390 start_codon:yes stop_codon:yes gene_type:complete
MAVSSIHNGWRFDRGNTRLDFYYRGTRAGHINATTTHVAGILTVAGASTVTGLLTASAAMTVTTGDLTNTAGNVRVGAASAFGTTEPVSWAVFKVGTAPVGAITTSGGVGTNGTVMQKIIADGTVSTVG